MSLEKSKDSTMFLLLVSDLFLVIDVKVKIDGLWFANALILSCEKVNNNNSLQTRQELHEESIVSDLSNL